MSGVSDTIPEIIDKSRQPVSNIADMAVRYIALKLNIINVHPGYGLNLLQ